MDGRHSKERQRLRMRYVVRRDTEVTEVVEGTERLRMRDVVRRDMEVTEVVEGTAKVKNEIRGEERHGGDRRCGGDGEG